jgi:allophanate hydrolase
VAVPKAANLTALSDAYRDSFERSVVRAAEAGLGIEPVDISVLLEAALLLYDGAFVAERYAAVGEFLDTAPAGADPHVAAIITAGRAITGPAFAADLDALARARVAAAELLAGFDALALPTTTEHPALADVAADPFSINRRMGTYTNFCNLLDMAAVAVPGVPTATGGPFGVTIVVPAFHDQVAVDIAARFGGALPPLLIESGREVALLGLEPLRRRLELLGARHVGHATPKPGRGAPSRAQVFRVSEAGLGRLLADLPAPVMLTAIELEDGRTVTGLTEQT